MSLNKLDPLPPINSGWNNDNSLTNYRTDFIPHALERPYVHKHEGYVKPQGHMEDVTSYKQEYVGRYL